MDNSVKTIEIKNFKGIKEKSISTEDKSIFYLFGKNGSGKTSFIHAVGYGLTGKCPGKPLRDGENEGYVSIQFNDAESTTVCRYFNGDKSKPNKVTVNGRVATSEAATNLICRILCPTLTNEQLEILVHPESFNELMTSGNLASFLFSLIPEKLTLDTIIGFSEYSKKELEIMKTLFTSDEITLDDCKDFYSNIFGQRRGEKRLLQELIAKCKSEDEISLPPHIKSETDLEYYTKVFYSHEATVKAYNEALSKYETDLKIYKAHLLNIEELERRKREIGTVDSEEGSLEELQKASIELSEKTAAVKAKIDNNEAVIKKLAVPGCPLGAGITCLANREEIINTLKKEIDELLETYFSLLKERDVLSSKINIQKANEKKLNEIKILDAKIAGVKETLKEPVKPVLEKESATPLPFDFNAEEKAYRVYVELQKNIKARNAQQETVDALSSLCDKFSPKGDVTDKIINFYIDILDDYSKDIAEMFGYNVCFVADEGLRIMVKPGEDSGTVEFKFLSRGETLIATTIVYHMINRLLGCGLMVIDNFNDLDDINRGLVSNVLNDISVEYSLIVVAGTP